MLAYEWMKENLPEEYHQFLSAVYSVLDDEGKDSEELHQLLDPETESMTTLQLSQRIGYFSNPYVSDCGQGLASVFTLAQTVPVIDPCSSGWPRRKNGKKQKKRPK